MTTNDGVTAFLYVLLTDHLPAGTVEAIIEKVIGLENSADGYELENDYLARFADEVAEQIRRWA